VALAALLATACGVGGGSTSANVGYGKDQPKVKITFWYMPNGSAPNDYFKAEAAAFNAAHPNIQVEGTLVDWSDAFSKITASLTSGVGPDVSQLGTTWVGAFSKTTGLHQFSQEEIDGLGGKSAFVPASWNTSSLINTTKTTAIPWFIDTRAVYYRSDVLKDLGIDPKTAFTDWSTLDQTLAKIKASGKMAALGVPGKNDFNVVHNFAPWIWGAGGDYVSGDGSKPAIGDSASVDGVNQYQQLAGKYVDPAVLQKNSNDVDAMFAQGRFAVTFSGPWLAQMLQTPNSQNGYGDDVTAKAGFGTASFPTGPKNHAVFFGGSNLAVLKGSKHEQAAYEWIRWLTSDKGQTSYVPKVGLWPARVSAAGSNVFAGSQYLAAFHDQLQFGRSYQMVAAWGPIENVLVKDLGNVWDAVSQANGPIPRSTVNDMMQKTNQDVQAAIQQSQ
jgi:multiple sugar transport system substrate-binding protein